MRTTTLLFSVSFFINGVFGDEVKSVPVMEGDSVTLHTDIKADDDLIATWTFGPQKYKICEINREAKIPPTYEDVQIFRNRLKLNSQNGDLTITNIRTEHTGVYNVRINFGQNFIQKSFSVDRVVGGVGGVKSVSVIVGDSVTLRTDDRDIKKFDVILWSFEHETLIELNRNTPKPTNDDVHNGIFKGRLQLNVQNGFLDIRNIRTDHSGLYEVDINSNSSSYTIHQSFTVNVHDKVKSVSVKEGGSDTLQTHLTEIQSDDEIMWRFVPDDSLIAQIYKLNKLSTTYDGDDGRFRGKLKLNNQTGDLTIIDIRPDYSGLYELKMSLRRQSIQRRFNVNVEHGLSSGAVAGICFFILLLIAAAAGGGVIYYRRKITELLEERERLQVYEGESVNLKTEVKDIKTGDVIEWRFNGTLIAKINPANKIFNTYNGDDDLFRDKLKVNPQTGDLTIKNIREEHTGVYTLKIISGVKTSDKTFRVVVKGRIVVDEGESVTLKTEVTAIQRVDLIEWRFRETLIAEINPVNKIFSTSDGDYGEFKDKLKLNHQTGDLNINDISEEHDGVYKLKIIRDGKTSDKTISVSVRRTTEELQVYEGKSSDLKTKVTDIQRVKKIEWRFGETLIAEINPANKIFSTYDGDDDLFGDKLKLNDQTGDLNIKDIRQKHAGVYKLKIIRGGKTSYRKFSVFVFDNGVEQLHVNEGDYFTLKTKVTDIKRGDVIKWKYGYQQTLIAQINPAHNIFSTYDDRWEFINKLELNHQTGDLTIIDIREVGDMEDMEEIILEIIRDGKTTYRRFNVFFKDRDEWLDVNKGESVDLKTKLTDIQGVEKMEWKFRDENEDGEEFRDEEILIAEINPANNIFRTYGDGCKGLFRDKLKLNHQTGDLTISDFREKHDAEYILKIIRDGKPTYRRFFVSVRDESLKVKEGESVDLKSEVTDMQRVDLIEWRFVESLIAEINPVNNIFRTYDGDDDLFRDKLKLNPQTGDLTINDFRHKHNGDYIRKIIRDGETSCRRFRVYAMIELDFAFEREKLKVNEGESVHLNTEVTDIKEGDLIEWKFRNKETPIAVINPANNSPITYDDDDLFRDKLKLNPQTGDLNIKDFREEHTGGYELKIIRGEKTSHKSFKVSVRDHFNKHYLKEGASVHLKTEVTDIQRDDVIEWRFTMRSTFKGTLIAKINPVNNISSTYDGDDDLFRDKLKLNHQTGDLIINDFTQKYNGDYKLKIIRDGKSSYKRFRVYVMGVIDEILDVYERSSVDLKTEVFDIQRNEKIEWRFGETLIAEINPANKIFTTYDGAKGLFRDKLMLNPQTGDLKINDIRQKHAGVYKLKTIRDGKTSYTRFLLSVRSSEREDPVEIRGGDSVRIEMQPLLNKSSQ